MNRRDFIVLTASALAAPLAQAQGPTKLYRLGLLSGASGSSPALLGMFLNELRKLGYVEGQNLVYERRYAAGKLERASQLAEELVQAKVRHYFGEQ